MVSLFTSSIALSIADSSTAVTCTVPSSSTSTSAPVLAIMPLIVFPPGPISSPILKGSIFMTFILGANLETCFLGSAKVASIASKIFSLAFLACFKAASRIGNVNFKVFTSNCSAVIPFLVPATLKSMSPLISSIPTISVRTAYFLSFSITSPIAIPDTGLVIGTPASISDNVLPLTEAIEVEPLELVTSETTLIV